MSPGEFAARLMVYCWIERASVTSWGRTAAHNAAEGGVERSPHRFWVGADVVYDLPAPDEERRDTARRLGLTLIREANHDHLQPAEWKS